MPQHPTLFLYADGYPRQHDRDLDRNFLVHRDVLKINMKEILFIKNIPLDFLDNCNRIPLFVVQSKIDEAPGFLRANQHDEILGLHFDVFRYLIMAIINCRYPALHAGLMRIGFSGPRSKTCFKFDYIQRKPPLGEVNGWGGRIRTSECKDQNLVTCHLSTPHYIVTASVVNTANFIKYYLESLYGNSSLRSASSSSIPVAAFAAPPLPNSLSNASNTLSSIFFRISLFIGCAISW